MLDQDIVNFGYPIPKLIVSTDNTTSQLPLHDEQLKPSPGNTFTVHSRLFSYSSKEHPPPPKNDLIESLSSIPITDRLSYASFSQQIADIQRLIQQSGLKYVMHATGTTLEGTWDEVSQLIGFAHTLIHQEGIARVQTDIRIQTRTDKVQPIEGHISSVEAILSASAS
ncbi:hypothetical protein N7448_005073 [Penicillium atrosanguineum]|nr:hypothetical protein N7526_007936 [Penicillium atrosanguineum]KAJ5136519.1 hypothetical protein N7448_005073 [Penicillium atrosanguineum]